jgi:hypothetical protein
MRDPADMGDERERGPVQVSAAKPEPDWADEEAAGVLECTGGDTGCMSWNFCADNTQPSKHGELHSSKCHAYYRPAMAAALRKAFKRGTQEVLQAPHWPLIEGRDKGRD